MDLGRYIGIYLGDIYVIVIERGLGRAMSGGFSGGLKGVIIKGR